MWLLLPKPILLLLLVGGALAEEKGANMEDKRKKNEEEGKVHKEENDGEKEKLLEVEEEVKEEESESNREGKLLGGKSIGFSLGSSITDGSSVLWVNSSAITTAGFLGNAAILLAGVYLVSHSDEVAAFTNRLLPDADLPLRPPHLHSLPSLPPPLLPSLHLPSLPNLPKSSIEEENVLKRGQGMLGKVRDNLLSKRKGLLQTMESLLPTTLGDTMETLGDSLSQMRTNILTGLLHNTETEREDELPFLMENFGQDSPSESLQEDSMTKELARELQKQMLEVKKKEWAENYLRELQKKEEREKMKKYLLKMLAQKQKVTLKKIQGNKSSNMFSKLLPPAAKTLDKDLSTVKDVEDNFQDSQNSVESPDSFTNSGDTEEPEDSSDSGDTEDSFESYDSYDSGDSEGFNDPQGFFESQDEFRVGDEDLQAIINAHLANFESFRIPENPTEVNKEESEIFDVNEEETTTVQTDFDGTTIDEASDEGMETTTSSDDIIDMSDYDHFVDIETSSMEEASAEEKEKKKKFSVFLKKIIRKVRQKAKNKE